jgi:hypothetical protein
MQQFGIIEPSGNDGGLVGSGLAASGICLLLQAIGVRSHHGEQRLSELGNGSHLLHWVKNLAT